MQHCQHWPGSHLLLPQSCPLQCNTEMSLCLCLCCCTCRCWLAVASGGVQAILKQMHAIPACLTPSRPGKRALGKICSLLLKASIAPCKADSAALVPKCAEGASPLACDCWPCNLPGNTRLQTIVGEASKANCSHLHVPSD